MCGKREGKYVRKRSSFIFNENLLVQKPLEGHEIEEKMLGGLH
jgi:hypothetical protein